MGLPSPLVLINGQPQINGINVAAGSTVTISLASNAGVYAWNVQCIGTDDLLTTVTINASLVINHSNNTATFTAPSPIDGYDSAMIFSSIVNNGTDVNGVVQPTYSNTLGVYILNYNGLRVGAQNETLEGNSVYGWLTKFNGLIRGYNYLANLFFPNSPATAGQFMVENNPATGFSWASLTGDVANTTTPGKLVVEAVNGATVPQAGSLTIGTVLVASGPSSLTYALGVPPVFGAAPLKGQAITTGQILFGAPASSNYFSNNCIISSSSSNITVPVNGYYRISSTIISSTTYETPQIVQYEVYINSDPSSQGSYIGTEDVINSNGLSACQQTTSFENYFYLEANNTVDIRLISSNTNFTISEGVLCVTLL